MPSLQPFTLLRFAIALILLTHSIPGMLTGGVHDFGTLYLDPLGFAPFGLVIAWLIKISHIACAAALVTNKFIKWPALITLLILIVGIFMVHLPHGWFVVGGGRNGVEYNFLLVVVLVSILLAPQKTQLSPSASHHK